MAVPLLVANCTVAAPALPVVRVIVIVALPLATFSATLNVAALNWSVPPLLTVIVPVARAPPRPASVLFNDACTLKLNVVTGLDRPFAGVNFNPALPSATVMKLLLGIAVVPLFLNSVPF